MAQLLLIDKPAGITSHDVVDRVRKITGERTVGHAGTLDPFATGLLIVAVGREETKNIAQYVGMTKEYEAEICIGRTSTTLDPESDVTDGPVVNMTEEMVKKAMQSLTGDILQIPPMYSAIKIGGKKLYDLARQGIEVERAPRPVTIFSFALLETYSLQPTPYNLHCSIKCSSGTYIRALARDLGLALGTVGYLTALRRTAIGDFRVENAVTLDALATS